MFCYFFFFFFFSSRRRHTRWNCDWSSDVCSSDLGASAGCDGAAAWFKPAPRRPVRRRSEERRVGKECRSRWWPDHEKKKMNDWDLHLVWTEAELEIIPNAGHLVTEPVICDAVVLA